ncbi:mannosyltransferase [Lentinus tigrinus ALCF2SS1-7]|uniref:Alpha-1,3/1,6-mannosyltransferase ALG2 n=1 Tax=Lentinus tigrinus ALCF2SS1-6 TaxID=1328759 RepID=A0A5C2SB37_9APHY|nr:mannosyltransferase [Lentinus tigrinus ALCF2SS1-6]RPD75034.1 mannosyltransferase [Lentinus tigrinus ALCF2SS1-7]
MVNSLRIAFIHPDLGIGGAERLVVDAALGLQKLGHSVDIYTSHHDPGHCFEETRDGTLRVHHIVPPFPRAIRGKLHILFSHARQLHLTAHLIRPGAPSYDVYFVDQLSTCIPFLRTFAHTRVLFYCHFPDKLLAEGAYVEGQMKRGSPLKRLYRLPMDLLEEVTTKQADTILANSKFTVSVFKRHMPSIKTTPRVVYPGINLSAYAPPDVAADDPDIAQIASNRPTILSLNRFEQKKNHALAIDSFALLRQKTEAGSSTKNIRLVLAGGYDPRLQDNVKTLQSLLDSANAHGLTYSIVTPSTSSVPLPSFPTPSKLDKETDILFLLNFSMTQRSALLTAPSTLALLYTPANEHFGIGPVEGMVCGLPVLACNSGGPTESIVDTPAEERTGWLRRPDAEVWAEALAEIVGLTDGDRKRLAERAKRRAREHFGMEAMARDLEDALLDTAKLGPVPTSNLLWLLLALVAGLIAGFVLGLFVE